ncbi:MAG: acyl carrier protein [Planctomyces sp.]|nr:acyl carrier protein [Planctomyces sp.]MBA4038992.1 acyl carrier protein [Planctomyces sp.]MBA4120241.1 acyl carrier protein [Isosphaera sp.]
MNDQEIETKVVEIVAKVLSADKNTIRHETNFDTDLNADSLDQVELVMELEEAFNTKIPDEEAEKLQTVGAAISYIKTNFPK